MTFFKTLAETSNNAILDCFNDSFSDYSIPFRLTIKQLESKIQMENINLELSIGAFQNEHLIGFVLHGDRLIDDNRVAYNAGTGVRPTYRGNRLTQEMYNYIIPILQDRKIQNVTLEVISNNIPAIKSYESVGFEYQRDLACYSGELTSTKIDDSIDIIETDDVMTGIKQSILDIRPSWQNTKESILNLGTNARCFLAQLDQKIVGFCILNGSNNRILQIGVDRPHRNNGIGSALLSYIKENISKQTSIINVDTSNEATNSFFLKSGLELLLTQKEMIMPLSLTDE